MTRKPPRQPLIAVIGATGTGKSQLAVEIAKRYNGEIINGDAMQLYAGLPVITNKITVEERQGIPHHLLGCIGLQEQTWVVGTFVREALATIAEIRSRGRLPILVGGTHYYTQSLLFKDHLAQQEEPSERPDFVPNTSEKWPILQGSTETLLEELKKVDPVMAERWHPNDRRKIQRSLEIYLQTGKRASDVYAQQRQPDRSASSENADSGSLAAPGMRFPTLLFWAHAEKDDLRARLDKRVDKMLAQGLLDEVQALNQFAQSQLAEGQPVDETRGIWVSIGYKEFKEHADLVRVGGLEEAQLLKSLRDALERTQTSTRQYAKRQIRWIGIKLVNALAAAGCSDKLYLLDGSNLASFHDDVVSPALDLTERFLGGHSMPLPASLNTAAAEMCVPKRDYDLSATPEKPSKQHCELCNVTCVTPDQWLQHTRSKAHKKLDSKHKLKAQPAKAGDMPIPSLDGLT